jgi:hypothetical protein
VLSAKAKPRYELRRYFEATSEWSVLREGPWRGEAVLVAFHTPHKWTLTAQTPVLPKSKIRHITAEPGAK